MKQKLLLCIVTLLLTTGIIQSKPQFGRAFLFNDNWRFKLEDVKVGAKPDLDDSKWRSLNLPHDWTIEGVYSPDKASSTGYLPGGIGWYRKTFTVPLSEKVNKTFIYFEGVYNHSEVFINGTSVGKRPNGYISFMYDLTPYLKYGGENLLSVRVDHSKEVDSRWYTGSGIYRDTYLVYASPVHLDLWGVYFKATGVTQKSATISVQTTINNSSLLNSNVQVLHQLINPVTGKIVVSTFSILKVEANKKATISQALTFATPRIWSLEHPSLYNLKTIIKQNGKVIDQNEQNIGVRTLTFDPDKGF